MRIAFVEMCGFRGFKNFTRFDFPRGFAVITGRNGVGKSTAFDAIDFALTGLINKYEVKAAKGGGLEDHLWWLGEGSANDHFVRVGLVDDEERIWQIKRTRFGDSVAADIEQLAPKLCIVASQMPTWPEMLMKTSLIRDEMIAALSLDLNEQARFTAVRSALGESKAPASSERTKELLRLAEAARDEQSLRHAKLHEELGRTLSLLTEARSAAASQDKTDSEGIIDSTLGQSFPSSVARQAAARNFVKQERSLILLIRELLANAERLRGEEAAAAVRDRLEGLAGLRLRERQLIQERDVASERLAEAEQALQIAKRSEEHVVKQLALLDQGQSLGLQDGQCPLCSTIMSDAIFEAAIEGLRQVLMTRTPVAASASTSVLEARRILNNLEQTLTDVSDEIRRLESWQERIDSTRVPLERAFLEHSLGDSRDLSEATATLLKHQANVNVIDKALLILDSAGPNDRVASLQSKVEQIRGLVDTEAAKLNDAEKTVDLIKRIDKASRIVANELLREQFDTVLPLLKELYQRLRPHSDWREIEIDIAGQVRASLNFTVGNGKNPQFLFSSGQRRAAGIAFLLAIHLSRTWCGLRTLMMDDPVQHVDDYRALNLIEVLSSIRKMGRQVIIAVEDRALADVLCRRLRSTTGESGKRFDLSTNLDGSASIEAEVLIPSLSAEVFATSIAS
jgi:chromosome segregation protein